MTNQFPQRGRASRRRILIWRKSIPLILALALACPWPGVATPAIAAHDDSSKRGLDPIRGYISNAWDTLTRSLTKCETVVDPKLQASSVLYLPADFPVPESVSELQKQC
ncbi:MAG: hypothetical protein WA002_04505, partial [Candidatus Acidiferrales bacterium]